MEDYKKIINYILDNSDLSSADVIWEFNHLYPTPSPDFPIYGISYNEKESLWSIGYADITNGIFEKHITTLHKFSKTK